MSTRCNIVVKEGHKSNYIYHHCDGYPSYMGKVLKTYINNINSWCGEYIMTDIIKHGIIYNGENDNDFEWSYKIHGDVEYIYLIDCNKHLLKCYKRPGYDVIPNNKFEKTFEEIKL